MSGLLALKAINNNELDSKVKRYGNKLNVYFDYEHTNLVITSLSDRNNNIRVVYSKHRGSCSSYEEKMEKLRESKMIDYHDRLDHMFTEYASSYMCHGLTFEEITTKICGIEFMPEVKGLCFITAGYMIGRKCAESVYGDNKSKDVSFIIDDNNIVNMKYDDVKRIAARFIVKDIINSSNLGYSYYNKSIRGNDGRMICTINNKIFGIGEHIKSLTALMRNFTDFVPIGFSWSSYTPFWMQSKEFIDSIRNDTVFGYDMIEINNFSYDGREIHNVRSVTYMTTKRRVYDVLGVSHKYFNFKFMNEVMAGLFFGDLLDVNPSYSAKGNGSDKDYINPMKYLSLSDDEKSVRGYAIVDDDKFNKVPAAILAQKYWSTMESDKPADSDVCRKLTRILSNLTLDGILYADVASDRHISNNLFNYVS